MTSLKELQTVAAKIPEKPTDAEAQLWLALLRDLLHTLKGLDDV